jgi:hypothetical protein
LHSALGKFDSEPEREQPVRDKSGRCRFDRFIGMQPLQPIQFYRRQILIHIAPQKIWVFSYTTQETTRKFGRIRYLRRPLHPLLLRARYHFAGNTALPDRLCAPAFYFEVDTFEQATLALA